MKNTSKFLYILIIIIINIFCWSCESEVVMPESESKIEFLGDIGKGKPLVEMTPCSCGCLNHKDACCSTCKRGNLPKMCQCGITLVGNPPRLPDANAPSVDIEYKSGTSLMRANITQPIYICYSSTLQKNIILYSPVSITGVKLDNISDIWTSPIVSSGMKIGPLVEENNQYYPFLKELGATVYPFARGDMYIFMLENKFYYHIPNISSFIQNSSEFGLTCTLRGTFREAVFEGPLNIYTSFEFNFTFQLSTTRHTLDQNSDFYATSVEDGYRPFPKENIDIDDDTNITYNIVISEDGSIFVNDPDGGKRVFGLGEICVTNLDGSYSIVAKDGTIRCILPKSYSIKDYREGQVADFLDLTNL